MTSTASSMQREIIIGKHGVGRQAMLEELLSARAIRADELNTWKRRPPEDLRKVVVWRTSAHPCVVARVRACVWTWACVRKCVHSRNRVGVHVRARTCAATLPTIASPHAHTA